MKIDNNLLETLRNLSHLEIKSKQRRELIRENYTCLGALFGFDESLNTEIKKATDKKLFGQEAYEHIKNSLKEYDNKISQNMAIRQIHNNVADSFY
jgi:hypothetical protein